MIVSNGHGKYGFDAYGGKILRAEDMAFWMDDPQRVDPEGISFELGKDVEEVEAGFFKLVPTIRELFILNPECNINMTCGTARLFSENNVLIRGEFDQAAERFAKEYGLRFLHSDVELATAGDYDSPGGIDVISLRFYRDGSAYIHQNNICVGSSAGWNGGGEISIDLPDDFYISMDAKAIAAKCRSRCRESVESCGILSALLTKAGIKGGFYFDYSESAVNKTAE